MRTVQKHMFACVATRGGLFRNHVPTWCPVRSDISALLLQGVSLGLEVSEGTIQACGPLFSWPVLEAFGAFPLATCDIPGCPCRQFLLTTHMCVEHARLHWALLCGCNMSARNGGIQGAAQGGWVVGRLISCA